jgi:hypothetical protein
VRVTHLSKDIIAQSRLAVNLPVVWTSHDRHFYFEGGVMAEVFTVGMDEGGIFLCELCGASSFSELASDPPGFWAIQCESCKAAYTFNWAAQLLELAVWGVWAPGPTAERSGAGARRHST